MNLNTEELLEKYGWKLNCWAPLTISAICNELDEPTVVGTATEEAADFIISTLREKDKKEPNVDRIIPQLTYEQWLVGQILAGSININGKGPSEIAARAIQIAKATKILQQ